jgi:quercetin dioxygenase-like cupin family protein
MTMSSRAESTILLENQRARVTHYRFEVGGETGHHRHEYDYIVLPQTTGELTLLGADGSKNKAQLTSGNPYFREAGVEHNTVNTNEHVFEFIEIELK